MRIALFALILLMAPCSFGCYSPKRFQSDSADIVLGWSPKYRVVFEELQVLDSVEAEYTFAYPPPRWTRVDLNLIDFNDLYALESHDAHVIVTIYEDDKDVIIFHKAMALVVPDTGSLTVGYVGLRPPADWCVGPKGRVVRDLRHYTDVDDIDQHWTFDGKFGDDPYIVGIGDVDLRSVQYRLRVRIEVSRPLNHPVRLHPTLAAKFRSVL